MTSLFAIQTTAARRQLALGVSTLVKGEEDQWRYSGRRLCWPVDEVLYHLLSRPRVEVSNVFMFIYVS